MSVRILNGMRLDFPAIAENEGFARVVPRWYEAFKVIRTLLANIPAKTSVSMMANKQESDYFAMTDRGSTGMTQSRYR